jgi:hypothetical protein
LAGLDSGDVGRQGIDLGFQPRLGSAHGRGHVGLGRQRGQEIQSLPAQAFTSSSAMAAFPFPAS